MSARYLRVEDVAAMLGCSSRSVHELTRANRVPLRRIPGVRRVLFLEDELRAWVDGAELEIVDGGRVVRPKESA